MEQLVVGAMKDTIDPSATVAGNCDHCWHSTGNMLTSYPPKQQEICCYCGTARTQVVIYGQEDEPPHGPYLPTNTIIGANWDSAEGV